MNYQLLITNYKKLLSLPQKWLVIGILALIALLVTILATRPLSNSVISTNPLDQSTDIPIDSLIVLNFKKPVLQSEQSALALAIRPPISGSLSFPDNTHVVWQPEDFYANNTQYTITVTGKNLKDHTFTFRTRPASSTAQLFPALTSQTGPADPADPKQQLLQKLPFRTEDFTIQYTVLGDNIYITIHREPVDSQTQKALNWLKAFGFDDPETQLKVRYNIPKYLDTTWLRDL